MLALAGTQHGVFTRAQLIALGASTHAIKHRIERCRLFVIHRGVYGLTPHLTRHGWWMAAVLACGDGALLSHRQRGRALGAH